MRSGWDFAWFVPRRFRAWSRCTSIGTAAWNMTSSRARCCSTAAALVFLSGAYGAELRLFEAVEPHMGTLFRIKLYAFDEEQAKAAFRAAFDRVAQLDGVLSDYRPESELNRICRSAVGTPLAASADLFEVL